MIFIKLIYIIFIGIADFTLYSILNEKYKINQKWLWFICSIFIIVTVLHAGLFGLNFLMPRGNFLLIAQFLIELFIFHLVGKYYIIKIKKSSRLSKEVANFSIKMASFIFLKAVYIIVFIVQCIFILTRPKV